VRAAPPPVRGAGPNQVNLAIRWFAGDGRHAALPDHSSLTRIRQRWGEAVFRKVFMRIDAMAPTLGRRPGWITAGTPMERGLWTRAGLRRLEDRGTDYVIPGRKPVRRKDMQGCPVARFKHDAPGACPLPRGQDTLAALTHENGRWYRAARRDCASDAR